MAMQAREQAIGPDSARSGRWIQKAVAGWLIANHGLPIAKFGIVAIIGACAMAAPRRRWITTGLWMVATLYALIITFHLTQLAMA